MKITGLPPTLQSSHKAVQPHPLTISLSTIPLGVTDSVLWMPASNMSFTHLPRQTETIKIK